MWGCLGPEEVSRTGNQDAISNFTLDELTTQAPSGDSIGLLSIGCGVRFGHVPMDLQLQEPIVSCIVPLFRTAGLFWLRSHRTHDRQPDMKCCTLALLMPLSRYSTKVVCTLEDDETETTVKGVRAVLARSFA